MSENKIAGQDFPVWQFPLNRPHVGIKLGNTRNGLLVWGGENKLQLSIGLNDLWDHDGGTEWHDGQSYGAIRSALEANDEAALREIFKPTEKTPQLCPLGRVTLVFPKNAIITSARLDIYKAMLTVNIRKGGNLFAVRLGVEYKSGTVFASLPKGLSASYKILDAYGQPKNTETFVKRGFSKPTVYDCGFEQSMPHDPAVGFACVVKGAGLFVATARAPEGEAYAAALAKGNDAAAKGFAALATSTAKRWKEYWNAVPKVSLPNPTLQTAFDYGMYQFGVATDAGFDTMVAPLQGPWYADDVFPPWGGDYHFNINLQEYYWPAYHGNRLEHLRPVFNLLKAWMPKLRRNAEVFVGIKDGVMLPHAVDDTGKVMTAGFWTGMMDHGSTMWMADLMWRYYEFGGIGGKKFLREEAMPFMEGAFNVFWAMLEEDKDGKLSLPVGPSPEYRGCALNAWGRNASFQLAAAHRLTANLISAASALGIEADERWLKLRKDLPLASIVNDPDLCGVQIGLWDGLAIEYSHRHHSHLAGIFPFDTLDFDDPEWNNIIGRSLNRWLHFGMAQWAGWCVPWASIISTRVGNSEAAEFILEYWDRFFVNEGRGTLHDCHIPGVNLMGRSSFDRSLNRDIIQFDAAGGAVEAIYEMLCHERQGVTYIFRGAPMRWLDVSFKGIRSTDGILVSASRKNGKIANVSLEASTRTTTFRLANPWNDATVAVVRNGKITKIPSAKILEIKLAKGETVKLRPC